MKTTYNFKNLFTVFAPILVGIVIIAACAAFSACVSDRAFAATETHDHADGSWTALDASASDTLADGKYYLAGDVNLTETLNITGEVTLCLNGHVLLGSGEGNVIWVKTGAVFTLCDCDGYTEHKFYKTQEDGVAIFYEDEAEVPEGADRFTVTGGVVAGGKAESSGGGVYVQSAVFNMTGGTIAGNKALNSNGGGVYLGGTSSEFNMTGGSVKYNEAYTGGGIANGVNTGGGYGTINISGGSVSDNKAAEGGGIALGSTSEYAIKVGGKLVLSGTGEINRNKATEAGGGVWLAGEAEFEITGGSVSGNEAPHGGGVYATSRDVGKYGKVTLVSGEISYNTATVSGGGVGLHGGILAMNGGSVVNNEAAQNGGGVNSEYGREIIVTGGNIGENVAGENGGGICADLGDLTVDGGEIIENRAGIYGGGIYSSANTEITNGAVSANFASAGGGGIYKCSDTFFRMYGGSITLNTVGAEATGSAVYCSESDNFYTDEFILSGGEIKAADVNKDSAITLCDYGLTISGGYVDGGIYTTGDDVSPISVIGGYYSAETYIPEPDRGYLAVNTYAELDADYRDGYPYAVYLNGALKLSRIYNISVVYDGEPIEVGTELELNVSSDMPLAFEYKKRDATEYMQGLPSGAGYFDLKVTVLAEFVSVGSSAKAYYAPGDYAELTSFYIAQASPEYPELPESVTIISGEKLSTVTLPEGWTWMEPDEIFYIYGENGAWAEFIPADSENYYTVSKYVKVIVDTGNQEIPDPDEPDGETDPDKPGGSTEPEKPGGDAETDGEDNNDVPEATVPGGTIVGGDGSGESGEEASPEGEGLSGGEIAGVVVGTVAGALLIAYGILAVLYKKKLINEIIFKKLFPFIK